MRTARKLVVKKESLHELSSAELGSVAGGTVSAVVAECPSNIVGGCPTKFGPICQVISQVFITCPTRDC